MCPTSRLSQLDVVDLTHFLKEPASNSIVMEMAKSVRSSLESTGCLVVRNPHVPMEKNEAFLDMMEGYFAQPRDIKMVDCRPESGYQV
jgi:isopenicillin N synthase-like dioxygenase